MHGDVEVARAAEVTVAERDAGVDARRADLHREERARVITVRVAYRAAEVLERATHGRDAAEADGESDTRVPRMDLHLRRA